MAKRSQHQLIKILQEIQEKHHYLPEEELVKVANEMGLPPGEVYGVATFYSHFTLEPKGKHIIRVCDGTACHVRKSEEIIHTIQQELKINDKKKTSDDGLFTLEIVACLGACGLAPVVVVDEEVHGAMDRAKTIELLKTIREKEAANG